MSAEGKEVRAKFPYIKLLMGSALRTIHHDNSTLPAVPHAVRIHGHLLHGIRNAEDIAHLGNGKELCLCPYLALVFFLCNHAVRTALKEDKLCLLRLADHLPRQEVGMVLHGGDNDLVPLLHIRKPPAVRHKVQALGGVARKDDFRIFRRIHKRCHGMTRSLVEVGGADAQAVQPSHGVCIGSPIKIRQCFQHTFGALRGGGIIKIDKPLVFFAFKEFKILAAGTQHTHVSNAPSI